ncbi:MAG: DNA polymerase III subunit gamma/tau [Opitutus sp.]|nr:DNA polymerase III subunit gamma/tau [Opitutus sp.]MCS6246011.1 DNA polymerase III subunit gamma/tau [Opitutus sp.]MCS6273335.1 DNA polymerase III subunit gamma/tau [Opitutus sp.]MCS6277150.1 DNA polymerase III subunit gamma/tau [Opitutus sp.]MCS6300272.1 DNA polymerase III subunit gamma/tau [Opitutus sp.]
MPAPSLPWPASLTGTPAVAVIERAIERRRLSHSLLITGEDHDILLAVAHAIADRLLNTPQSSAPFPPESHPDCFHLRPAKKMRQISADATRELIGKVQVSATVATQKVAIIHECDRMNVSAANIFLKTLEEPPANTSLLLLTTRPYALLTTIRSRCLHFRFPGVGATFTPDGWSAWITDYQAWLGRLAEGVSEKKSVADSVFGAYGLTARFAAVLDFATAEIWKKQKAALAVELTDDEEEAMETGIANGLRARLFADIERATRNFALPALRQNTGTARRALTGAIDKLEHDVGLLRLNLNESAALEDFLLSSLRLWSARK